MMEITNVEIKIAEPWEISKTKVRAYATIIIDGLLVIKEIRIIQGEHRMVVSMPSKKKTFHCKNCHRKNPVDAHFCNQCGTHVCELPKIDTNGSGHSSIFTDVIHPINAKGRVIIEHAILLAYDKALQEKIVPLQPLEEFATGL